MVDFRSGRGGSRPKFVYHKRTTEQVQARASQQGGMFDSIVDSRFPFWKVEAKAHTVRILPATWEDPTHYGLDLWVHYGIGADSQSYLCLQDMKGEACPLCDAHGQAVKLGDTEMASALQTTKRILVWMIDRENEKEGPQLWNMPWTFDKDLAILSGDKHTGENILIDDPDQGFDVDFTREGKQLRTKYVGLQIARRSSPLHPKQETQDAWLDFIVEHPLPSVLHYFPYEHIKAVFEGRSPKGVSDLGPRAREEAAPRGARSDREPDSRGGGEDDYDDTQRLGDRASRTREQDSDQDDRQSRRREESVREESGRDEDPPQPPRSGASRLRDSLRNRARS